MALTTNQVSQLYVTLFGRASEGAGNTYWQSHESFSVAADTMLATEAAATYFGASLDTDLAYIQYIYVNTLGKTYAQDTAGVDYWVDRLTSGDTRGEVAAALCTAVYDYADSTDVVTKAAYDRFVNRVAVSDYCAENIDAADAAAIAEFTGYISGVTDDSATVVAARAAIYADADPSPSDPSPIHSLTTNNDSFTGSAANDHFYGIYDGVTFLAQNTFNSGDILDGAGGTDTLHIQHFEDVAIDLPDTLWTGISRIEKIVINTTGSGAHDIITGTNFNTAFASNGVDLSTTTTGDGAITINMSSFTGTAKLAANSAAGAIVLSGVDFAQIDVRTTGAGAQTITSTGAVNVIVNATSSEGATSITTGAGGDTITLHATAAGGLNTIAASAGADTINLYTNFSSIDTIVQADGDSLASTANTTTSNIAAGQTITFGNGLDIISNFGVNDILNVGTGGAAVSGLAMNEALFAATKTIFFSGTYAGNIFTIAADGGGTDTLLLDTTAAADRDIATADTWILLTGVISSALSAGSFV